MQVLMWLKLFFYAAIIGFSLVVVGSADGQVVGATGRTTSGGSGTFLYTYGLSGLTTITCSGSTCSNTSSNVSPGSQVVFGTLTFNSTHDLAVTIGGASGGGAGLLQVSCNGGSTWLTVAIGSGSIPGGVSYSYPTPTCTGVTNLNTLLFRLNLSGGGSSSFNMTDQPPASVTISW